MAARVTQAEKELMWKLYQKYGCFKTVAKELRRSPDTVSKYVHEYETALGVARIIINGKQ